MLVRKTYFIRVFISASFVWRFDKGKIGGKPGYRDAQSFSSTQLLSSNESNGWKNGRILTLPLAPSPRPNGERAGVRGFDLETLMPPHPDPLLPRGRRGRKQGQCQNTPDEPADNGINKLVMSQFGVRGHVRALEHRDMSRCGKAATRRRIQNQDSANKFHLLRLLIRFT